MEAPIFLTYGLTTLTVNAASSSQIDETISHFSIGSTYGYCERLAPIAPCKCLASAQRIPIAAHSSSNRDLGSRST